MSWGVGVSLDSLESVGEANGVAMSKTATGMIVAEGGEAP